MRLLVTVIQLGQSRVVTPSIAHPAAVIVTHHPVPSRLPGRPVVAVPLPLAQRSFARLAYSLPPIRFRLPSGDGWEPLAERSGDVLGIVPPTLGEWSGGAARPPRTSEVGHELGPVFLGGRFARQVLDDVVIRLRQRSAIGNHRVDIGPD